eukprot:COSAG01_NODE_20441_length_953_cov_0.953162_1_plen_219_part_10
MWRRRHHTRHRRASTAAAALTMTTPPPAGRTGRAAAGWSGRRRWPSTPWLRHHRHHLLLIHDGTGGRAGQGRGSLGPDTKDQGRNGLRRGAPRSVRAARCRCCCNGQPTCASLRTIGAVGGVSSVRRQHAGSAGERARVAQPAGASAHAMPVTGRSVSDHIDICLPLGHVPSCHKIDYRAMRLTIVPAHLRSVLHACAQNARRCASNLRSASPGVQSRA